ncbi:MAG: transposase [Candidatus Methanomethylophilaceae archaeon]|nr:transposase [Candidatus Methanomethylophilaceae archaeon]
MKTIKFRIEPNSAQRREMDLNIEANRIVYNAMVYYCRKTYDETGKLPSVFDLNRLGTRMRKNCPIIAKAYSLTLNETTRRVIRAFKDCINNCKKLAGTFFIETLKFDSREPFPRYKSRTRAKSYTYPREVDYSLRIDCKGRRSLILGKVPGEIRCYNQSTPINGKMKTCTVKRKDMGTYFQYYVSITYEEDTAPITEADKGPIGVDMGISNIVALSDGTVFKNDHAFLSHKKNLKKLQRRQSRLTPGTRAHKRLQNKINHIHEKIENRRRNNIETISAYIVKHHDPIVMENLSVGRLRYKSMNRRMTNGYNDASLGELRRRIQDKAESAGRAIILVDPKGTSQECSQCGSIVKKTLKDRVHSCPKCGIKMNRDVNAAINILKRSSPCPLGSTGDPVPGT